MQYRVVARTHGNRTRRSKRVPRGTVKWQKSENVLKPIITLNTPYHTRNTMSDSDNSVNESRYDDNNQLDIARDSTVSATMLDSTHPTTSHPTTFLSIFAGLGFYVKSDLFKDENGWLYTFKIEMHGGTTVPVQLSPHLAIVIPSPDYAVSADGIRRIRQNVDAIPGILPNQIVVTSHWVDLSIEAGQPVLLERAWDWDDSWAGHDQEGSSSTEPGMGQGKKRNREILEIKERDRERFERMAGWIMEYFGREDTGNRPSLVKFFEWCATKELNGLKTEAHQTFYRKYRSKLESYIPSSHRPKKIKKIEDRLPPARNSISISTPDCASGSGTGSGSDYGRRQGKWAPYKTEAPRPRPSAGVRLTRETLAGMGILESSNEGGEHNEKSGVGEVDSSI
ncbi:hypothetical protein BCR39DRAFT_552597 [Naematelia encephala]|uniref:BRCT domain-containing protein n=1 Tax=Naematelia encephala TaxID=71784 RepID=A0A1Y2AH93_9TREE|nr:hypothetical protein BCR39DRAFT_552597 [Naematelia encephala]